MACKSSMVQSLSKKISNILDPYPRPCRTELSNNTCNQSIQHPSSLCALQDTPNNCPSNPSIQKHCQTDLLDSQIKCLLHEKLTRMVVKGRPFETMKFHRRQLLKQLADWIGIFDDNHEVVNNDVRSELLNLLTTACKQNIKDVPMEDSEWTKLLNQWLKVNTSGMVISRRDIYRILAVDGFNGFKPKDLKYYLSDALLPLRKEYKLHYQGVRKMYNFFDENSHVCSLTGTDSACVIFLALLEWYSDKMKNDVLLDDQIMFQVQQAKTQSEGYLQQHAEYFHDIKNVDDHMLKMLGEVYYEPFKNEDKYCEVVGHELLTNIRKKNSENN